MQHACDRRPLLILVPACMAVITLFSLGFALSARQEAEALRTQVEELTIRAERDAETARQTIEFLVDLFDVREPPVGTVTTREVLESRGDQAEDRSSESVDDTPDNPDRTIGSCRFGESSFGEFASEREKTSCRNRSITGFAGSVR
jgi:hypothetical protein